MESKNIDRVGCVLPCGINNAAYQVGALRALADHGIKVDVISGSGAGALNAVLLDLVGVEMLEYAWSERSLYWKIMLTMCWRSAVGILFFLYALFAVLITLEHPAQINLGSVFFLLAVGIGAIAVIQILLRGKLMSALGDHAGVSSKGKSGTVSVTLSEKAYFFDPIGCECLSSVPFRGAPQALSLLKPVPFYGKVKQVLLPIYHTLLGSDRSAFARGGAGGYYRFLAMLLYSGAADPVPVKPVLDAGCSKIFIIDPPADRSRSREEEMICLLKHLNCVERKLLLAKCEAFELVARYNVMLAASGAECQLGSGPNYAQIGKNLLESLQVEAASDFGAAELFLVTGKGRRLGWRWGFLTKNWVAGLIAAGYSDMHEVLDK